MKGLANVGDVLADKYRVDKILGIGGMGMVVAATHLELGQQVAVKFMLPAAMKSPEASARFLREARAAGKLTSQHICRVTDVGRFDSGAPYIVMEYLEGYDLGTMLRSRGPLRVAAAVDYVLQACEGLAEAHAHGIVHRDLKPDNLYLSARADGGHLIKVLDFGISKAAVTGIQTGTGEILGSPAYMSPEQMKSTKDVDARADVWSLGAVMYQLLTGRLPFTGDSLPALCLSVLNDDPVPPSELRHDLPEGLSAAILRCLAKEPEDRFADIGELAAALGPFATPDGVGSVTRVRSALRGRKAPPDPSQTVPHGFPAQAPAAPGVVSPAQAVGITTVGSSAGESIDASTMVVRRRRLPLGIAGGLLGALGLAAVLAVVVLRGGGSGGAGAEATTSPQTATQAPDPARPPSPQVTPIEEPDVEPATAPSDAEPGEPEEPKDLQAAQDDQATHDGQAEGSERPKGPRGKRLPKGTRGSKAGQRGSAGGSGGSGGNPDGEADVTVEEDPTPPPDADASDEDKWGRMHHDQPKDKSP